MHKVLALPAVAFIAIVGLSTIASAESGHWYTQFQVQSCKKMPSQAGCIGFDSLDAQQAPVVQKAETSHSGTKIRK